jgi:hypothetical protein
MDFSRLGATSTYSTGEEGDTICQRVIVEGKKDGGGSTHTSSWSYGTSADSPAMADDRLPRSIVPR